jgi:hypothetical protein
MQGRPEFQLDPGESYQAFYGNNPSPFSVRVRGRLWIESKPRETGLSTQIWKSNWPSKKTPVDAVSLGHYIHRAFRNKFARPSCSRRTGKRVEIPRCRATVSEDTASGHWSDLGRPGQERNSRVGEQCSPGQQRMAVPPCGTPYSRARRPARTSNTNPFRE